MTSAEVKELLSRVAADNMSKDMAVELVASVRSALQAYGSASNTRTFGATRNVLYNLAKKITGIFADGNVGIAEYANVIKAPVNKSLLAARVLTVLDKVFPVGDGNVPPATRPNGASSVGNLMLQAGEYEKIQQFLASLRGNGGVTTTVDLSSGGGQNATLGVPGTGPVVTLAGSSRRASFADRPPVVSASGVATTWNSLLQSAGVAGSSSEERRSEGLSFWCPLAEKRRMRYSRGPEALAADCQAQIRRVKAWPRPPHPDTVQKANELRVILPLLAQATGVMPALPLHEDVLRLYTFLLESRSRRSREESQGAPATITRGSVFGALSPVAPARPGLDAVASARFANTANGLVVEHSSEEHLVQCVHIMEQFAAHKVAPKPKPLMPMSVRVYIQQTMAPSDARVADAYSIVKGVGAIADHRRDEVKTMMVQVFERANEVAFERVKRGTAVDREKRRALGQELSHSERQASLQRESLALAELRVLARCLVVGQSAVLALRSAQALPRLAQDLIRLQPHLTLAQAMSQAKSMFKPPAAASSNKGITIQRPDKRQQSQSPATQRVLIQFDRSGLAKGSTGANVDTSGYGPPAKRGKWKRHCYWCQSTKHKIGDCPAKKQGLPKTKKK